MDPITLFRLDQVGDILDELQNHVAMLPAVLPVVRRQFPRPRFMRTCLEMAFAPNAFLRRQAKEDEEDAAGWVPSIRGAWMWLNAIDEMSRVEGQCMRRGCRARRHWRCKACQTVEYCSVACQVQFVLPRSIFTGWLLTENNRDWREHRLICGFRDIPRPRDLDIQEGGKRCDDIFTPPERFPFRFHPAGDKPWKAFVEL